MGDPRPLERRYDAMKTGKRSEKPKKRPKWLKCDECLGTGLECDKNHAYPCEECGGKGKIRVRALSF